jgi:hypothetical protein
VQSPGSFWQAARSVQFEPPPLAVNVHVVQLVRFKHASQQTAVASHANVDNIPTLVSLQHAPEVAFTQVPFVPFVLLLLLLLLSPRRTWLRVS